jgi:hypothetical protein
MWGLWADLPMPTIVCAFDEQTLAAVEHALSAHAGELARNDYGALVRARGEANAVLAAERVFGFGSAALSDCAYAEVTTEVVFADGHWRLGAPHVLNGAQPFAAPTQRNVDWWLDRVSVTSRLRQD